MKHEIPYLVMGFVAVGLVTLAVSRRRTSKIVAMRIIGSLGTLLLCGVVTATFFLLWLFKVPTHGGPPDFLTPFVALLIGVFFEMIFSMTSWLESKMHRQHTSEEELAL